MIRFIVCPDWPTNWLLDALAEKIIGARGRANPEAQEEADEVFEIALDKLIPPDPPVVSRGDASNTRISR